MLQPLPVPPTSPRRGVYQCLRARTMVATCRIPIVAGFLAAVIHPDMEAHAQQATIDLEGVGRLCSGLSSAESKGNQVRATYRNYELEVTGENQVEVKQSG